MNKQRRWQERRRREGRCVICGRPQDNDTQRCGGCREKLRLADAARWARRKSG